jgi:4-diphosphocytidyl-2-C-methyl-D-erythritol kinase
VSGRGDARRDLGGRSPTASALAPAKINLCLFVGPPRDDGRHELVTLFEAVALFDEVELKLDLEGPPARSGDRVVCPEVRGENLAAGALAGLREHGWKAPRALVSIRKRIPIAGGMAGGSADAAAVLRMAMALSPGLEQVAHEVAVSLGADVPAQLHPGLSIGTGAGELVAAIEPLAQHAVLVLPSHQRLSTASVYREADRLGAPRSAAELREFERALPAAATPGARLPDELIANDLQAAAVSLCPSIASALADALGAGAEQALVSGSGPTVLGLFWGEGARERATAAACSLAPRHPGARAVVPISPGQADAYVRSQ